MHTGINQTLIRIERRLSGCRSKIVIIITIAFTLFSFAQTDNTVHTTNVDLSGSPSINSTYHNSIVAETYYEGNAIPIQQVTLKASMDGIIKKINVKEGDHVTTATILAQIDDAVQQLTVNAARIEAKNEAELRNAKINLDEAEILLESMIKAFEDDSASEWEVRRSRLRRDQTQAAYDIALKNHELAQISLQREQEYLNRFAIKAPFDGQIIKIVAEPGASLIRNDQILFLAKLDILEVPIDLPAELYSKVKVGQTYKLTTTELQWADSTINATLRYREPMIVVGRFRCVFELDNSKIAMPAGITLRLPWPQ